MDKEREEKKGKRQETIGPKTENGVKVKQYKVGITAVGFEKLNTFMAKANRNSKRRIRIPETLEYLVGKLSDNDIEILQERVYTASDRLEVLLEESNANQSDHKMTKDELLLRMIETYKGESQPRAKKVRKSETADPRQPSLMSSIG